MFSSTMLRIVVRSHIYIPGGEIGVGKKITVISQIWFFLPAFFFSFTFTFL